MNTENTKTVSFLLAAAVLTAAAWFSYPRAQSKSETQVVGNKLFPGFTDTAAVNSLTVQQYDQANGKSVNLEVAKSDNLWILPSHGNYPADAKDHLAAATNSLIDLKILGLAPGFNPDPSTAGLDADALRKAYNQYGVVDPDPDSVKSSDTGVGTRITMKDAAGKELASAIIGKAVSEQGNQCYVRKITKDSGQGKDPVYVVQLDPTKLAVKFADWIEPNLLNLNSMDLKQVHINDYTVDLVMDPQTQRVFPEQTEKGEYRLDLPSGEQPWKLIEDLAADEKADKLVPRKMAADEELNTAALDAMKSALEDLKIVDVERKPAKVPADLRISNIDETTQRTLLQRGFLAVPTDSKKPDSPLEILSKFGQVDLQLNDGACYVLRFGNTTGDSSSSDGGKDKKADSSASSSSGLDRFLLVMAEFKQDAIPKPAVEKLPDEKPAPKASEKKDEPKKDEAGKADEGKKADATKADADKDAKKAAADRKAAQERVDIENKRRMDEYNDKVAAGKKHVEELNKRFAQWYYVIPGDVYEKIHLDHKSIVKKKEPPKDDHDHDHGADLPVGPAGAVNKLPDPAGN